jgi:hypothetical protein
MRQDSEGFCAIWAAGSAPLPNRKVDETCARRPASAFEPAPISEEDDRLPPTGYLDRWVAA